MHVYNDQIFIVQNPWNIFNIEKEQGHFVYIRVGTLKLLVSYVVATKLLNIK